MRIFRRKLLERRKDKGDRFQSLTSVIMSDIKNPNFFRVFLYQKKIIFHTPYRQLRKETRIMDEILKFLAQNGKLEALEFEMKAMKRKEILKNYHVWQGKNGLWYTYLPDKEKGRILKKRKTKESIEDAIISFEEQKIDNPTFEELFYENVNRRVEIGEIKVQTKWNILSMYKRFFSKFGKKHIADITPLDVEELAKTIVYQNKITKVIYVNAMSSLKSTLKYARKRSMLTLPVSAYFDDIDIPSKAFVVPDRSPEKQIFTKAEEDLLIEYLIKQDRLIDYGIILCFYAGLRVGELASLERKNIMQDSVIVERTVVQYYDFDNHKHIREVGDTTKTPAGQRRIYLRKEGQWVLKKLTELSDGKKRFVFEHNGTLYTRNTFEYHLKKACKDCKIPYRSLHKCRKTYGTRMKDNAIPDAVIINQMGHSNIDCLNHYYYFNRQTQEEMREMLCM